MRNLPQFISLIEQDYCTYYRVMVTGHDPEYLNCKTYSMADALTTRAEQMEAVGRGAENPDAPRIKTKPQSNKVREAPAGVCYVEALRKRKLADGSKAEYLSQNWTAMWQENGKTKRKWFSINKYGDQEAYKLAVAAREKAVKAIKEIA